MFTSWSKSKPYDRGRVGRGYALDREKRDEKTAESEQTGENPFYDVIAQMAPGQFGRGARGGPSNSHTKTHSRNSTEKEKIQG